MEQLKMNLVNKTIPTTQTQAKTLYENVMALESKLNEVIDVVNTLTQQMEGMKKDD
jgi:CII-binding regulator of phage lambda lysogenization HflD